MHLCLNMLIFTHNLGNWLIPVSRYVIIIKIHRDLPSYDYKCTATFFMVHSVDFNFNSLYVSLCVYVAVSC